MGHFLWGKGLPLTKPLVAGEGKPWTYNRDRRFDVTDLWRQLNHVPSSVHHPSPMIGSSSPPFSSVSTWVSQTLPSVPNAQMQKTINGHTFGDLYSTEDKTPIELAITHARIMLICFLFSLAFSCVNRPPPKKKVMVANPPRNIGWLYWWGWCIYLASYGSQWELIDPSNQHLDDLVFGCASIYQPRFL